MLQALFENRKAINYFAYGLVVKVVLQVPFIYLLKHMDLCYQQLLVC